MLLASKGVAEIRCALTSSYRKSFVFNVLLELGMTKHAVLSCGLCKTAQDCICGSGGGPAAQS
jgi:hypothetical protein